MDEVKPRIPTIFHLRFSSRYALNITFIRLSALEICEGPVPTLEEALDQVANKTKPWRWSGFCYKTRDVQKDLKRLRSTFTVKEARLAEVVDTFAPNSYTIITADDARDRVLLEHEIVHALFAVKSYRDAVCAVLETMPAEVAVLKEALATIEYTNLPALTEFDEINAYALTGPSRRWRRNAQVMAALTSVRAQLLPVFEAHFGAPCEPPYKVLHRLIIPATGCIA